MGSLLITGSLLKGFLVLVSGLCLGDKDCGRLYRMDKFLCLERLENASASLRQFEMLRFLSLKMLRHFACPQR